jgi:hypothetical protein
VSSRRSLSLDFYRDFTIYPDSQTFNHLLLAVKHLTILLDWLELPELFSTREPITVAFERSLTYYKCSTITQLLVGMKENSLRVAFERSLTYYKCSTITQLLLVGTKRKFSAREPITVALRERIHSRVIREKFVILDFSHDFTNYPDNQTFRSNHLDRLIGASRIVIESEPITFKNDSAKKCNDTII